MLLAIAIYKISQNKYQKIYFAQEDTTIFFSSNQLEKFEKMTLGKESLNPDKPYHHIECSDEHHYIKKGTDSLIAVVSKKELTGLESYNLLNNIHYIQRKTPDTINASLQNVIKSPLGFTGKDLSITDLQRNLDDTKKLIAEAIASLEIRQPEIKKLETGSFKLRYGTEHFEDEAKKLNSCC